MSRSVVVGAVPDASKIVAEGAEAFGVDLAEGAPPLMLAGLELALRDFKIPQALLPLGFEAASHETIFRFDRAIPALGAFGSIPRALDRQPPLRERGLIIVVELLRGDERGVDGGRSEGREERRGDGLVDLDPADGEAVDAAARDEILARAVIARRGRAPAVMRVQPATAVPAGGEALQQRGAFSHGATRQVWMRVDVAIDARLIGFVRLPVNEAFVVTREEDAPVGARQPANSLLDGAVRRDVPLAARSTIDVGASIYRIGEQMVNRGVRRHDPADAIDAVGLQRERQLFGAKPEPDLAHRAEFGEAGEDGADRAGHCFVGMEPDLAVVVAPHEADRQAAAQLAAGCFVADAAFETGAEDVQLGFTHRALESEDQPVVEQGRVVDAVGIADQGVGHTAQIEEAIPVGVVAREARDLEAQDEADLRQRDVGGEPREADALSDAGAGEAQVFVDDRDLLTMPAEGDRAMDEGILPLGRLAVVLDLRGARLPDIDHGSAMRVAGRDLARVTHRTAPRRSTSPRPPWRTGDRGSRSRRPAGPESVLPTRGLLGRRSREASGSIARWPSSSAPAGDGTSPELGRRRRRASTTVRVWSKSARAASIARARGAVTAAPESLRSVQAAGMSERLPSGRTSMRCS